MTRFVLTSFQPNGTVEQEMVKLARTVASKISIAGSEPAELSYFPRQNQIPHTARYLAKDVLGQTYFPHGFEAHYKGGTNESKLVLIVFDSPAAAQDAMARYRQTVSKDEKNTRELTVPGEGGFVGKDRFYGNLAAARRGQHIVVALGTADEASARKQLAEIVANIK